MAHTKLRRNQLVDSSLRRVLVTDGKFAGEFDLSKQEVIVVPVPTNECARVGLVAESTLEYRVRWVFSRGMALDRVIMFRDSGAQSHHVAAVGSMMGVGWESYRDYSGLGLTMALVSLVGDYMRWNCGQLQIDEVEGGAAERLRGHIEQLCDCVRC